MPIYKLKLIGRHEAANNTLVFNFEKPSGFSFKPGQYGGFTLINPEEIDALGITRRFSLLSTPEDQTIAIATRMNPLIPHSAYKRAFSQLPIGAEVKFAGPTGTFTLHEDETIPAVLIAGGIGIAPFYSMIKQASLDASQRHIQLFYGNQSQQDAAFLTELKQLSLANFQLIAAMNQPAGDWQGEVGFISEAMIRKYVPDLSAPIYYICGSPAMVTALQETLAEMGVNEERIRTEDFPGY